MIILQIFTNFNIRYIKLLFCFRLELGKCLSMIVGNINGLNISLPKRKFGNVAFGAKESVKKNGSSRKYSTGRPKAGLAERNINFAQNIDVASFYEKLMKLPPDANLLKHRDYLGGIIPRGSYIIQMIRQAGLPVSLDTVKQIIYGNYDIKEVFEFAKRAAYVEEQMRRLRQKLCSKEDVVKLLALLKEMGENLPDTLSDIAKNILKK